jgi:hypothetical protein
VQVLVELAGQVYALASPGFDAPTITELLRFTADAYFVGSPDFAAPLIQVSQSNYSLLVMNYAVGPPTFANPPLWGEDMTQITPDSGLGGLIVVSYDVTGLATVHIEGWPLVGWDIDPTNPVNPVPITIGNPLVAPPNTGSIISPGWAHYLDDWSVYVPTPPSGWRGSLAQFCTWLATNSGANRLVTGWFTQPNMANAFTRWARENPEFAG